MANVARLYQFFGKRSGGIFCGVNCSWRMVGGWRTCFQFRQRLSGTIVSIVGDITAEVAVLFRFINENAIRLAFKLDKNRWWQEDIFVFGDVNCATEACYMFVSGEASLIQGQYEGCEWLRLSLLLNYTVEPQVLPCWGCTYERLKKRLGVLVLQDLSLIHISEPTRPY